MGIFRQFPYSNFHDMNMNEIIKIVRQLADDWVAYQLKWGQLYDDTAQALEDFKTYVQNYFNNLDLQDEVNTKINNMVADGTFNTIVRTQLSPVISDWLAENIVQEPSTIIDKSLSIENAAAEASIVGEKFDVLDEANIIAVYDPSTNRNNLYYRTGGILTASEAWKATALMELEDGYTYYYKGLNNLGQAPVNVFFTSNRQYISEFSSQTGYNLITPPANAKYVAFSVKNEDVATFEFNGVVDNIENNDLLQDVAHIEYNTRGVYSNGGIDIMDGSISVVAANRVKDVPVANRIKTGYVINNRKGTACTLAAGYEARVFVYDDFFNVLNISQWINYIDIANKNRLFRVVLRKSDNSAITVNDFATATNNYFTNYRGVFDLAGQLEALEDKTNKPTLTASIEDSAWSWWVYPQVMINNKGRHFAAYGEINCEGIAGIGQVNLDTQQELKLNVWDANRDDHNGMAILKLPNDYILIAGAKHDDENLIHLWRSKNKYSIDNLNTEIVVEFPSTVTYVQLFNTPNNRIAMFVRCGTTNWYCCYSLDDTGSTWEDPFELINSNMQYYCMFRPTTDPDYVNVAMYSNPNIPSTDTRIRCAKYNLVNRKLYDSNNVELGGQDDPVLYSDVPIVIDIENWSPTGTLRNRLLDLAISAAGVYNILYILFNNATDGVYYASLNGNVYSLGYGGGCFYTPSCYYGGAIFKPKDTGTVFVSKYVGNKYVLEEYEFQSSGYVWKRQIDESYNTGLQFPICRPIIDVDGEVLFYQKGSTSLTSFNMYNYDAKYVELTE